MAAVKISSVEDVAGCAVEQWIVVGAVDFDFEHSADKAQRIEQHADDVRSTADGIAILNSAIVLGGAVIFDVLGDPLGTGELAGVRLGAEDSLVEVAAIAVQHVNG